MEQLHTNGERALAERLKEPETEARLNGLLDRLETLERALDGLAVLVERGPGMVAIAADTVDEAVRDAAAAGVDVEERLRNALTLADRLTETRTVALLTRLLELAEQAPAMVAIVVDTLDELYRQAAERGVDLEAVVRRAGSGLGRIGALMESEEYEALLSSGILDPEAVRVVGGVGQALVESQAAEPTPVGPLGLLRALRDPDVQRAVGFTVEFARQFGRALQH